MKKIEKINIYGGSGHAKVVLDCVKASSLFKIGAVCDDNPAIKWLLNNELSPVDELLSHENDSFLIAIGNNKIRKQKVDVLGEAVKFSPAIVHPSSSVSSFASINKGTVIMPVAAVNPDAVIGRHAIINTGAVVEHDCELGDFTHISPNASLAGGVKLGEGSQVGIGAQVIQGVTIGKWVTIGAGAVIIKDIPDGATVVGNPGRIIKNP